MVNNDPKQRYLNKVRAVEYANKIKRNSTKLIIEKNIDSPYSYDNPYLEDYEEDFEYSNQNLLTPGESLADSPSIQLEVDNNKYYYPKNVSSLIQEDYKKNAKIRVFKSIEISTEYYRKYGKIPIPSGNRASYTATMVKLIEENGGHPKNSDLFDLINEDLFVVRTGYESLKVNGTWLRKDLIFYLEELHKLVAKEIGVDKLIISSAFRTVEYNYNLYSGYIKRGVTSKRVYWSPHMAGIAVDIAAKGRDRAIIANAAYSLGFGGIAIGRSFVHIDIGPYGRWKYSGVPKYISPSDPGINAYS